MARSRSSFEITGAVAAAAALSPETEANTPPFADVPLVSFAGPAIDPASAGPVSVGLVPLHSELPPSSAADMGEPALQSPLPPPMPISDAGASPVIRCEQVVAWILDATGASDVFLADAAGLPLAGAIRDEEARLAASGLVASAAGALAAALPGAPSPVFELHLGEGPFFQLIGFQVDALAYMVGLVRAVPLTPRQAQVIRAGCRQALEGWLGGSAR